MHGEGTPYKVFAQRPVTVFFLLPCVAVTRRKGFQCLRCRSSTSFSLHSRWLIWRIVYLVYGETCLLMKPSGLDGLTLGKSTDYRDNYDASLP